MKTKVIGTCSICKGKVVSQGDNIFCESCGGVLLHRYGTEKCMIPNEKSYCLAAPLSHVVRGIIHLATLYAETYGQATLNTLHLLRALIVDDECKAFYVLKSMEMDFDRVRRDIEKASPQGPGVIRMGPMDWGPDIISMMRSIAADDQFSGPPSGRANRSIGSVDVLLGILYSEETVAHDILRKQDVTPSRVHEVLKDWNKKDILVLEEGALDHRREEATSLDQVVKYLKAKHALLLEKFDKEIRDLLDRKGVGESDSSSS